jgi:hypothetical protein
MEELSHGFEGVTKKKGKVENFATTGTVLASAQESVLSTIVACLGPPLEQSWFLLETTRCLRVALEQGQTRAVIKDANCSKLRESAFTIVADFGLLAKIGKDSTRQDSDELSTGADNASRRVKSKPCVLDWGGHWRKSCT